MKELEYRLQQIEAKISQPNFRKNNGLGNEVGYYVFDYPAQFELQVRAEVKRLVDKSKKGLYSFTIVEFDLYEIMIDLLKQEQFLELCMEFEKSKGLTEIVKAVNEMLRMEEDNANNEILSYISKRVDDQCVIFLTGVGKCYPLMRSHKILNNLHQFIDYVPVVMFFPGKYDGQSLMLFSELKDDNYYRAFKLIE